MSLASSIKQFMESIMKSAGISSAGGDSPKTNYVKHIDFFNESGNFDDIFRADVVRIIQDEIKIQMLQVRSSEIKSENPLGSVEASLITNVKKGVGLAQNPSTIAAGLMSKLPHAALVALAISLYPIIIKELTRAGGMLDTRFRRKIELELNGFLDRQTQKNTQLGIRGVRIQSSAGFIQLAGAASSNTMRLNKNPELALSKRDQIGAAAHKVLYDGL